MKLLNIFKYLFSHKKENISNIDIETNLNHISIIMDWNRRWAKERDLPTFMWHKAWWENIKKVLKQAKKLWIKYVTLWGLSTDNIKNRSKEELDYLYSLLDKLPDFFDDMRQDNCRFQFIWDLSLLPEKTRDWLEKLAKDTSSFDEIVFTLAVAYGWRDEIIRWIKKFVSNWWNIDELSEENFREYLDSKILPKTDVIVRTWWDYRTSWYMLYDSPYAELYFTDRKWPEFDETDLIKVIEFFNRAKRNFGK